MSRINGEIFQDSIVKMGQSVGLDWATFDDALEYQKENGVNWYITQTWTTEQQDAFRDWMDEMLKKKTGWSARKRDWEIGCFILCYGWKTNEG